MDSSSPDCSTITNPMQHSKRATDPLEVPHLYSGVNALCCSSITGQKENIKSQQRVQRWAAGLATNAKVSSPPTVGWKWRKRLKAVQSSLGTRLWQAAAACSPAG